ncbi:hypothetical protein AMECASPLE_022855 [Ameca splendens]|uniref:Uncharacterized protein n=1 Tax=Ameca splendens TaxID=208324 RepID=A0ABV0Y491_9TELE
MTHQAVSLNLESFLVSAADAPCCSALPLLVSLSAVYTVTLDLHCICSTPVCCKARRCSKNHMQIAQNKPVINVVASPKQLILFKLNKLNCFTFRFMHPDISYDWFYNGRVH